MYRIGVDVGGTNTDAVLMDICSVALPSRGVLATCKTPTTSDVTSGIHQAVNTVLQKSNVDRENVLSMAVGTTQFVNAVIEADARRLHKIVILVIGSRGETVRAIYTRDFPVALRRILSGPTFYLDGGFEIDGREILPLDIRQIRKTAEEIFSAGVTQVVLIGVFSALDRSGKHEETCRDLMSQYAPTLSITCSHQIGGLGFLERENAAILNASILPLANRIIGGFRNAMQQLRLDCPLFLTQNDGTLTDDITAVKLPIKTFASGPTNSLTGASFLAGIETDQSQTKDEISKSESQVLVVDIGGTTTDVCALLPSGFPRQAPSSVKIGGVRTAFSMPDVVSIGLGGGSRIRCDSPTISVGPDSVGHHLTTEAVVFGGDVLTATDIYVASGGIIGNPKRVLDLERSIVAGVRQKITKMLEQVIEEMKVSAASVIALLVGGGSIIQMDTLDGIECIRPPYYDAANAVGAAIAKVAGEVDLIEILDGQKEDEVVAKAKKEALAAAVRKGAEPDDVKVLELEKIPLQYVTNKAIRLRVKAAGKLVPAKTTTTSTFPHQRFSPETDDTRQQLDAATEEKEISPSSVSLVEPSLETDIFSYRPDVRNGVWYISPVDLEFIAFGTGILGTGGGGSSYLKYLACLKHVREFPGKMRVVSLKSLKRSDLCVSGFHFGAPSVSGERIPAGTEIFAAHDTLNRILGHATFKAIVVGEIGGGNGLSAFPSSVHYDRPVVDADLMGRAFPTVEHIITNVYGYSAAPCAIADAKGNVSCVMGAESNAKAEKLLRSACIELGLGAAVAIVPLSGVVIKEYAIPKSLSQAWYLGRAAHQAQRKKTDFIQAIFDICSGKLLFTGKIIDVKRDVSKGYTIGHCLIRPLSAEEKEAPSPTGVPEEYRNLIIPFQNEYLYAAHIDPGDPVGKHHVICTVPDLISILGSRGTALGSQELRYGLHVTVIGIPTHPLWTSDRALRVGGPRGFGLEMDWVRLGNYQEPRDVIEEFNI